MDEVKHPHTKTAGQIDVSLVKHCLQQGDAKLALQYCHELLVRDSQHIQTLLFATLASRSLGWLDDALDFINRALAVAPSQPAIHSLMGDILLLQNRPEPALTALLKARHLGDVSALINFNIGSAYLALGTHEDAKNYFDQALSIAPQMVAAHVNKGLAEHSLMNLDAALDCFDAALCIDPKNIDAQWNKSHVLLTLGRYEEGFKLYETRWHHPQVALKKHKFDSKLWLGQEHLAGKTILLHAEGGFGDTIQFIRYAKLFDPNVKLIIQCQVPLIELVKGMELGADIIAPGDTPPPHDFHCPLMSLPLAFGTNIENIPIFPKYLFASESKSIRQTYNTCNPKDLKIGIMVRGSESFQVDRRSLDINKLNINLPRSAKFVLLQQEVSEHESEFLRNRSNWSAPCPDFSKAAEICEQLDLVISIDTSIAHLSSAIGKPTIILLPFRCDWRWGNIGNASLWYPSAFLIRQTKLDDWSNAFDSIVPTIREILSK